MGSEGHQRGFFNEQKQRVFVVCLGPSRVDGASRERKSQGLLVLATRRNLCGWLNVFSHVSFFPQDCFSIIVSFFLSSLLSEKCFD